MHLQDPVDSILFNTVSTRSAVQSCTVQCQDFILSVVKPRRFMRQVSLEQALKGQNLMAVRGELLRIDNLPEFPAARDAFIEARIGPETFLKRNSRIPAGPRPRIGPQCWCGCLWPMNLGPLTQSCKALSAVLGSCHGLTALQKSVDFLT
ncbi:hypothetical protein N431DRAFT_7129 [Stipitochalara longipes BDJ]|nr:hypothetical protein N431DRAFT_7129 [Stipitochalara longipes BDJ]